MILIDLHTTLDFNIIVLSFLNVEMKTWFSLLKISLKAFLVSIEVWRNNFWDVDENDDDERRRL